MPIFLPTQSSRHWLRYLFHRPIHGHVLQHDHSLGRVLPVRLDQVTQWNGTALDEVQQPVEH